MSQILIGDVLVTFRQSNHENSFRAAASETVKYWPNGYVPYFFEEDYPEPFKEQIRYGCKAWSKHGGVLCSEVPRPNNPDDAVGKVRIQRYSGCYATAGYRESIALVLNVSEHCLFPRTYIHEWGHVLGLHHEHQRPDRDQHISIDFNKLPERWHNAHAILENLIPHGTYDKLSIMHYRNQWNAFSSKINPNFSNFGGGPHAYKISEGDKDWVREIYGPPLISSHPESTIFHSYP